MAISKTCRGVQLLAMLWMLSTASAQVVITIGLTVCPTSSALQASLSGLVPTYLTMMNAPSMLSYSTLTPPSPSLSPVASTSVRIQTSLSLTASQQTSATRPNIVQDTVTTSDTPTIPTSTASPQSYSSGQNFSSSLGELYLYEGNTVLLGVTIVVSGSGSRVRQEVGLSNDLFMDCVNSCDQTSICEAVSLLGSNCMLFGAVSGFTMVVGAQTAYNELRFKGYQNVTIASSKSSLAISSAQVMSSDEIASPSTSNLPASASIPVGYGGSTTPSEYGTTTSTSVLAQSVSLQSTPVPADYSSFVDSIGMDSMSSSLSSSISTRLSLQQSNNPSPVSSALATISSAEIPTTSFSSFVSSTYTPSVSSLLSSSSPPLLKTVSTSEPNSASVMSSADGLSASGSATSQTSTLTSMFSSTTISVGGFPTSIASSASTVLSSLSISLPSTSSNPTQASVSVPKTSGSLPAYTLSTSTSAVASPTGPSLSSTLDSPPTPISTMYSSESMLGTSSFASWHSPTSSSWTSLSSPSTSSSVIFSTSSAWISSATTSLASSTSPSTQSTWQALSTSGGSSVSSVPSSVSSPMTFDVSSVLKSSSTTSAIPTATPVRNSGKRGLCYTNDTYTLGYSLSGQNSLVSWGYDYFYSRYTGNDTTSNPALTFIPLLFNDNPSLTSVWPTYAQQAIDQGSDALLSFNEPDSCYGGSACMTVNQSVIAYMNYMQPFASQSRLGAPAVTNGGPPSSLTWLSQFLGNCTSCTIDFIPLHWYSNVYAFSYLQYYVETAYNLTFQYNPKGIPIWVTEFGIDSSGGTDAQYQAFLEQALPWLDAVPYVERYAYFYDAPGYLINANGSGLSAQGVIYNSYTKPCVNWNNSAGHC